MGSTTWDFILNILQGEKSFPFLVDIFLIFMNELKDNIFNKQ